MTKQILVGGVPIGGGAPVVIQSMLNTKTTDVEGSLKQIRQLASAGCQIARLAVPNMEAARSFADICKDSALPLVADIHFDYRLAIAAAEGGASKIRINPGNIGGEDRVKAVVEVCKDKHIPIRIGVNGGSLDKRLLEKYGHPTAEALVESAFEHLELLEKQGFYDTCVSMKSSTVPTMVAAARLFRAKCDYPLHIGVTETGPVRQGLIKSAMGIGALLLDGIGDTIRVSLTDDPVQEVYAARDILKAAGLRKDGVNIVSCPTCGRTRIDLIGLVNRVDEALKNCEKPITVACWPAGKAERRYAGVSHIDCERVCQDDSYADYVKKLTSSKGLEISSLAFYPNTMDPDLEKREAAISHLKAVIRASAKLGVNMVTTFIGKDQHKTFEENIELFRQIWPDIIALAEQCGVKVAIENCPMLFGADQWPGGQNLMCTPKIYRQLFEIIPSPNFGLNFDPSHYVWQGLDYVKTIYDFSDRIFHVHFKDIKLYPEKLAECGVLAYPLDYMSPKIPGLGDVNWSAFVSALNDIRYNGCAVIEVEDKAFEGSREDILNSIRLSKRYLDNFLI